VQLYVLFVLHMCVASNLIKSCKLIWIALSCSVVVGKGGICSRLGVCDRTLLFRLSGGVDHLALDAAGWTSAADDIPISPSREAVCACMHVIINHDVVVLLSTRYERNVLLSTPFDAGHTLQYITVMRVSPVTHHRDVCSWN